MLLNILPMKRILLLTAVILTACTGSGTQTFHKAELQAKVNGTAADKKELAGTFEVSAPDEMGLVEVKDADNRINVKYFKEADGSLKMLNVKMGNKPPVEFRASKGHELYLIDNKDTLGFMFADPKSAAGDVRGTVLYLK